jgi:phospholipid/cholesterol/gamma-HCH transport system substrate-binding protein
METRARYVTIGAFTLAVIVLAFGFIYWLKRLDETGIRSAVYFEFQGSVGGLAPGGAVFFAGIKVGNVTSLAFDQNDPNRVLVTAEIREDTPIKADTKAVVGANLLTGVAYIDMTGGTNGAQSVFAMERPTLRGSQSGIGDMITAANSAVVKVEQIADRIDKFVAANDDSITRTVTNVETFTKALAENSDGVQDFLANVAKMSETVSGLSQRLNGLVDKADAVVAAIEPDKVRSTLDNADAFVRRIADASVGIEEFVESVKKVSADVSDFAGGLNTMLEDVRKVVAGVDSKKITAAVDNFTSFSEELKKAAPSIDAVVADARKTVASANQFTDNLNANQDSFNAIVADAKELADRLNESSKRVDSVLGKAEDFLGSGEGEGKNFFQEAAAAAKSIREAADTVTARADEIAAGISKFSGRGLENVSALVGDLRATAARIDRAVSDFGSNPAGALLGGNSGVREYNRR